VRDTLKENVHYFVELAQQNNVKLIAVTKTVPVDIINTAISYGITAIGENRVQELLDKYELLNKNGIEIHLIGHLQTNKVKYIIDKVDLIHSVDSLKLANEINKHAKKINKVQNVLVQVNVSKEASKGGVDPESLTELLVSLSQLSNIKVCGLMCIPLPQEISGDNSVYFAQLHKMLVDNNNKNIDNINMDILSMGMSSDYLTAIKCGSNMIRVGTKIFGKRNYTEV